MGFTLTKTRRRLLLACAAAACLASCTSINYYAQAAQGQLSLMADARPIDDWLADSSTDAKLRQRLTSARQIRQFAVEQLGLPDNASYRNYAALKRPYVLWNVVAAPELSLTPREWCFPVAGCVNYRGYYSKERAQAYARQLRAAGDDVQIGGVTAYSTLGWFNDPLISTFIHFPDAELARLIFHELSHQVVYVAGDSQFNESFASAVEEAGVERWLALHGDDKMRANYAAFAARKGDFIALLLKIRRALEQSYASDDPPGVKRATKARLFRELSAEYQQLKSGWGGYAGYDRFFAEPLSNAHLASVATYNDFVPAFRALLAREKTFAGLYAAARELASLDKEERHRRMHLLGGTKAAEMPHAALQH
jgi:predicted aminopeptidase